MNTTEKRRWAYDLSVKLECLENAGTNNDSEIETLYRAMQNRCYEILGGGDYTIRLCKLPNE